MSTEPKETHLEWHDREYTSSCQIGDALLRVLIVGPGRYISVASLVDPPWSAQTGGMPTLSDAKIEAYCLYRALRDGSSR